MSGREHQGEHERDRDHAHLPQRQRVAQAHDRDHTEHHRDGNQRGDVLLGEERAAEHVGDDEHDHPDDHHDQLRMRADASPHRSVAA